VSATAGEHVLRLATALETALEAAIKDEDGKTVLALTDKILQLHERHPDQFGAYDGREACPTCGSMGDDEIRTLAEEIRSRG
jgi:hypothetical protein